MKWCDEKTLENRYGGVIEILARNSVHFHLINAEWDHVNVGVENGVKIFSLNGSIYIFLGDLKNAFLVSESEIEQLVKRIHSTGDMLGYLNGHSKRVDWLSEFYEQKLEHFKGMGWFLLTEEQKSRAWSWLDEVWMFPESMAGMGPCWTRKSFSSQEEAFEIVSGFISHTPTDFFYAFDYSSFVVGLKSNLMLPAIRSCWMVEPIPYQDPTYFVTSSFKQGFFWFQDQDGMCLLEYTARLYEKRTSLPSHRGFPSPPARVRLWAS